MYLSSYLLSSVCSSLRRWMAVNYTGPSALTSGFHATLHVNVMTFPMTTFDPTVANIVADPLEYAKSLSLIPTVVAVFLLGFLAVYLVYIMSCRCCCCCKTMRMDKDLATPSACYFITVALFAGAVVAAAIVQAVYHTRVAGNGSALRNTAQGMNDYLEEVRTTALSGLDGIKVEAAIIHEINATTSTTPFFPSDQQERISRVSELLDGAIDSMDSAASTVNITIIPMDTVNHYADLVSKWTDIGAWSLAAFCVLLTALLLVVSFAPQTPCSPGQYIFMLIMMAIGLGLGILAACYLMMLVGFGDICEQPYQAIDEQFSSAYVSFYVRCPPGSQSPIDGQVDDVQVQINGTKSDIDQLADYFRSGFGANERLYNLTLTLSTEVNATMGVIDHVQELTQCTRVHGSMVEVLNTLCHGMPPNFFWAMLALLVLAFGPLLLACMMPRKLPPPDVREAAATEEQEMKKLVEPEEEKKVELKEKEKEEEKQELVTRVAASDE